MAQHSLEVYPKIRRIVVTYLIENVGEMAMYGIAQYDRDLARWRVPILCRTPRGNLPAGEVQLTKQLRIAYVTPREEMMQAVNAQVEQLEKLAALPLALFQADRVETR